MAPFRRMQTNGVFITFEGGEGAGKTTQVAILAERLRQNGERVRLVREPGGTEFGEEVRRILKHAPYGAALSGRAELLLFAASRAQLVKDVIRPALRNGEIVLCDRFTDSSLAYQGAGRGLPEADIAVVNSFATENLCPDLTLLLNIPVSDGRARIRARAPESAVSPDRMEAQSLEFYEKVRTAYLRLAAAEPSRFVCVDATQDLVAVASQIWEAVTRRLATRGVPTA